MSDSTDSAPLAEESDRARRLFLFLRDLSELRSKPVREIVDYESVVWFNDRPDDFGWSRFSEELDDDLDRETWLEMERVRLPKPPVVPESLEPWIRRDLLGQSDLEEPGLIEPEEAGVEIPDSVSHVYESYLGDRWVPWAEEHRRLKPAYDFYSSLFAMNERRQRLGEVYELVIGVGLLSWNRGGQRVQRHLVTSPVEISVDSSTGRVDIRPSGTEGRNRLELDMLDPHDRGPAGVVQDLVEKIENLSILSPSWTR